jgi:hypothetical protein
MGRDGTRRWLALVLNTKHDLLVADTREGAAIAALKVKYDVDCVPDGDPATGWYARSPARGAPLHVVEYATTELEAVVAIADMASGGCGC